MVKENEEKNEIKNRNKKFIWAIVTIEAAATFTVIFIGFRTYENKVNSNKGENYS